MFGASLFSFVVGLLFPERAIIPFALTNYDVISIENGMVEFTSMTSGSDTIYLLRDVEQVEGDKFTASLVETISDLKGNVTLYLEESSKYDSVVYFIHGFQNHAHIPIFMSQTHNNKADSTSLMIPYVSYSSSATFSATSYNHLKLTLFTTCV